jgi:hypothetical protein
LFLRAGGHVADTITLLDISTSRENPRITAYRVFDSELDFLKTSLKTSRFAEDFERAIARLFLFMGFQVDVLAGNKCLDDAVDAIAYGGTTLIVLAIECTTGSIDASGKLRRLTSRVGRIREVLPDSQVIGVDVTLLKKSDLSQGEINDAAQDRIARLDTRRSR